MEPTHSPQCARRISRSHRTCTDNAETHSLKTGKTTQDKIKVPAATWPRRSDERKRPRLQGLNRHKLLGSEQRKRLRDGPRKVQLERWRAAEARRVREEQLLDAAEADALDQRPHALVHPLVRDDECRLLDPVYERVEPQRRLQVERALVDEQDNGDGVWRRRRQAHVVARRHRSVEHLHQTLLLRARPGSTQLREKRRAMRSVRV
eukprot:2727133-Pleurochrysis_carterae.AAC.1